MISNHPCEIYGELHQLSNQLNSFFYGNTLPQCMISLRPRHRTTGAFSPACWGRFPDEKAGRVDGIILNSPMLHEMCHPWQRH